MPAPRRCEQIKLALALQRHLPLPAPTTGWPPDYYWDRYCQAARRVNLIQHKHWQASQTPALDELERIGESLVQQLRSITDLARNQMTPHPRASLQDILADLAALNEEFPEVRWDRREKTLSVITEPVELKDIPLGRFEILLEYRNLGLTRPYRIIALDPHPAAGEHSTTHPHVRDEELCEGDGRAPIQVALRQGRFYDVFVLIRSVLTT